jgi:hypothetical protein
MNESISGGAFLSLRNIPANLGLVARREALPIHAAVLLLGMAGAVMAIVRRRRGGAAWLLLAASISGALVALAYDRFDQRMLLGATVALLPLGGFAFDWSSSSSTRTPSIRKWRSLFGPLAAGTLVLLLVPLWKQALLSASVPPETQVLETRIASRVARLSFAADSLFIADQPTVLAAEGMTHVMATERALRSEGQLAQILRAGRPVYFLRDMYCEPGFQGAGGAPVCGRMSERFDLTPVVEETLHGRTYILYRASMPSSKPKELSVPGQAGT